MFREPEAEISMFRELEAEISMFRELEAEISESGEDESLLPRIEQAKQLTKEQNKL